ncbi:glutamine--fructose-6-phosphate transaminase (isomerizing) [Planctomicrobium piriforme]|uniref:Glutamine--fructose-6-phosphate aminotransferase [isomerizing] n=1 Tax=Planctomicrobium piriforme TaxID=1576369 RepID=A0A1I3PC43_9PLAN|nr:glutamine--fructose-6-phosphate transaminase (isomerizing) [Planctomicrobium piriforme]SFJ19053.1 glucosamine--fructose-6-phosphate aminotransferase (isomerizing) [Planctomicrobium piriforme]
MCGIVGYLGTSNAPPLLLSGLKHLEYRGYDSAGMAVIGANGLEIRRCVGRVSALEDLVHQQPISGSLGIAHTRWASHGKPSEENAHPHVDQARKIALVHNGIIENHAALRTCLSEKGVQFSSETDTEVLAQLIGCYYAQSGKLVCSVREALKMVQGTFGIAVICEDEPQTLIAARQGSPLLVGMVEHGEYLVASDPAALAGRAPQAVFLKDGEMAIVTPAGIELSTIDAEPVGVTFEAIDQTLERIELGRFEHYMQKEIHEQPESLRMTLSGRVDSRTANITLGGLTNFERQLSHFKRVLLFGCGSAWHAGLIGEYLIEELAELPTEVQYSSELRYRNPLIEEGTLAIAISQSGETADTLAALHEVRTRGATVLGIVNNVGSTIARETDAGVYLHVGPEIGVASTKAFLGQVTVLSMLAVYLGRRKHLSRDTISTFLSELERIPEAIEQTLLLESQMREIAYKFSGRQNWLYLGRGINYPTALEGALKLKEVSYIHAEGLPAAEMKHGPIAMIDEGMPVVVIATRDVTYQKILSNMEEVRSRGGEVIAIVNQPDAQIERLAKNVVVVPRTQPMLSPLVASVPLQLLAYHAALSRGLDVDKPRNLAKSVTVE